MPEKNESPRWEITTCLSGHTLRESVSGQLMHSRIGPWEEARGIYVAQSGLDELGPERAGLVLYDVGLGIAANPLALIEALWGGDLGSKHFSLTIHSFERYPEALRAALASAQGSFPFLDRHRPMLTALLERGECSAQEGGSTIRWRLHAGDFRDADLSSLSEADLAYFDFYAPSAQPDLWGPEIFEKLRRRLSPGGRLITYSAAKRVRAALFVAGFFVGRGISTELKSETTVAACSVGGLTAPLDVEWFESLARMGEALPEEWLAKLRGHPQFINLSLAI